MKKKLEPEELAFIFKYSTKENLKKFIERIQNTNLATNINDDPEFIKETVESLFKEYPFLKRVIDD